MKAVSLKLVYREPTSLTRVAFAPIITTNLVTQGRTGSQGRQGDSGPPGGNGPPGPTGPPGKDVGVLLLSPILLGS